METRYSLQVLLVDDDSNIRRTLAMSLKDLACTVDQAGSVDQAMICLQSSNYDLVLTDFKMEKQTGMDLIRRAKALRPDQLIVVMTAYASFENAVDVIKEGAFDYLAKPFTTANLSHVLGKIRELVALKRENLELKANKARRDYFSGFTSVASVRLEDFVKKVSPTDATVLLSGESGTGKSELAKLIHEFSPRFSKPFITIHCTSLAESLLESELFGHVKGSFTGAIQDKVGKLELADGGTLFLDEIGDLSHHGQTKLLRFLQDRVFEKVGGNREITVNARVIAATNKNLPEAVASGRFREDLYYRLNVFECTLVSLRHRKEDLPILIHRLFQEVSRGKMNSPIPKAVMDAIMKYQWPGNIRELRNVIERIVMLSQGRDAQMSDLPDNLTGNAHLGPIKSDSLITLEELEKSHIQNILSKTDSLERAAEILGITTVTLWRKRKEYGLA